jgi:conjugal transfer ATP-binding protein TraC
LAVGRLVLDPYSATLFSSSPKTFAAIDALIAEGLSIDEAIERIAFPDNPEKWVSSLVPADEAAIAAE